MVDPNDRLEKLVNGLWSEHKEALSFVNGAGRRQIGGIVALVRTERQLWRIAIDHVEFRPPFSVPVRPDEVAPHDHAEQRAALDMIHRHSPGSTRQLTLGADKGFDAAEFAADLRQACVTPHVAQKSRPHDRDLS